MIRLAIVLVAFALAASPAQTRRAAPAKPAAAGEFQKTAAAADAAREAGRLEEAEALYRKALKARPNWPDGLFALGTILYDQDRYEEARDVFGRYVLLVPKNDIAVALLGLCEFQVGDYDNSLRHLQFAIRFGLKGQPRVQHVALFHNAMLLNRLGRHENAWNIIVEMIRSGAQNPVLIQLAGLTGLRRPILPSDIPPEDRELVTATGHALWLITQKRLPEANREFQYLLARYPKVPSLHYTYGSFLLLDNPDEAVKVLNQELVISPTHIPALVALAVEYLRQQEMAKAREFAQRAVAAGPDDFAAHGALGRVLLESGNVEGAIKELQTGVKLAPDSPQLHMWLANCYNRLGRREEAQREQKEFTRLQELLEGGKFDRPPEQSEAKANPQQE